MDMVPSHRSAAPARPPARPPAVAVSWLAASLGVDLSMAGYASIYSPKAPSTRNAV